MADDLLDNSLGEPDDSLGSDSAEVSLKLELDIESLDNDQLFAVSRELAHAVFVRSIPIARKLAARYCKKYGWVNPDDLAQTMILEVPRFMYSYNPNNASGTSWSKYLFHKLYFLAKDLLRKEDPLGVKWPQKKVYPKWHRLADEALEGFEVVDARREAEELEVDQLGEDIQRWREYFAGLPKLPKAKKVKVSKAKRKRGSGKGSQAGLWSWRVEREKPKQLALWG